MFVNILKKNYDADNFAVIVLFISCSKGKLLHVAANKN